MNRLSYRTIIFLALLATVAARLTLSAQGLSSDTPTPPHDARKGSQESAPSSLVSSGSAPAPGVGVPSTTSLPSSSTRSPATGTSVPTGDRDMESTPESVTHGGPVSTAPPATGITSATDGESDGKDQDPNARVVALPPAEIDSTVTGDDYPRLGLHEYRYADGPRYTLTGSLPYRESHLRTGTAVAFGGALLALATSVTWYQQAWYPDSTKAPFHIQTDWGYSKQFDKAGHMFGGWMSAYCSYESFVACGLSADDAALWGSIGGLFFQTFMEVQDGFFSYGFDPTDELSNAIGAGYFYAQQKVPFLRNFDPKWSVGPNNRDSAREASQIRARIIVDDYDRQDVWLSARLHNLLPESLRRFWPKWLQLALGAGARDVELVGYPPYRELHLSLDYNLVELLPDLGSFGNWLIQGLNHFHLPAPALRLWPTIGFELLYPFRL